MCLKKGEHLCGGWAHGLKTEVGLYHRARIQQAKERAFQAEGNHKCPVRWLVWGGLHCAEQGGKPWEMGQRRLAGLPCEGPSLLKPWALIQDFRGFQQGDGGDRARSASERWLRWGAWGPRGRVSGSRERRRPLQIGKTPQVHGYMWSRRTTFKGKGGPQTPAVSKATWVSWCLFLLPTYLCLPAAF